MTEENSVTEDEEKRRAEYARKLVREKRSRMGLQSGKCHACGVPCDPKYGIYCTICSSKQNAMRAEATCSMLVCGSSASRLRPPHTVH